MRGAKKVSHLEVPNFGTVSKLRVNQLSLIIHKILHGFNRFLVHLCLYDNNLSNLNNHTNLN